MKVLIGMTRSDTTLSGSFTHICQTGEAFRARGAEVVYVLGGDGPANERLRKAGFKVHALGWLGRELHPLRDLLEAEIDFAAIAAHPQLKVFVSATHVNTGRAVVFSGRKPVTTPATATSGSDCVRSCTRRVPVIVSASA